MARFKLLATALLFVGSTGQHDAFQLHSTSLRARRRNSKTRAFAAKGFGVHNKNAAAAAAAAAVVSPALESQRKNQKLTLQQVTQRKQDLLNLLNTMAGRNEEYAQVEKLVNELEGSYQPAQTLAFFNFGVTGTWQLLFSTQLLSTRTSRQKFRLRELTQHIQPENLRGRLVNTAKWDLADKENGTFDVTGTFAVLCQYQMNQGGSRMVVELEEHVLKPTSSKLPSDVPALVGLLHRAMPKELFDPSHHGMDTTYLDANLRIVRCTGPRYEGVRDIFVRVEPPEASITAKE